MPQPCPTGHFCPEGTGLSTMFPCPSGKQACQKKIITHNKIHYFRGQFLVCVSNKTLSIYLTGSYGPDEEYDSESDCRQCPSGFYCEEPGLDTPTGECYAGYYCTGGALSPTPRNHMVRIFHVTTSFSLEKYFQ